MFSVGYIRYRPGRDRKMKKEANFFKYMSLQKRRPTRQIGKFTY